MHPENVQQRRLACAGRPHDRDELAGLDVQRDPAQHECPRGPLRIGLLEIAEPNERRLVHEVPTRDNDQVVASSTGSSTTRPSNRWMLCVGMTRVARIVGHHADRRAGLVELLQQLHHRFAALGIEVPGRLVGQQDDRLAGDRPRDGDALLLPARQLAGQVFRAMRHADAFERFGDALPPLVRAHPAIGQRQLHVLEHREIADQVEALEDEPDFAIADARALRGRQLRDRPAVQPVRTRRRRVEQAENRQQRRLAAARRTGNRDIFASGDLEAHVRQRVRLHLLGREHLRQVLELDDGRQRIRHQGPSMNLVIWSFGYLVIWCRANHQPTTR